MGHARGSPILRTMNDKNILQIALTQAAGGSGKQIPSAEDLGCFGACLLANIQNMLKSTPNTGGQQFGSATELATRYGRSVNTMKVWLRNLEKDGTIKPIQGAPDREGAKGDTLYSFAEVDDALRVKRVDYVRQQKAL